MTTPEQEQQARDIATDLILDHARDVEFLSIVEKLDDREIDDPDDELAKRISDLISTATITVELHDEEPPPMSVDIPDLSGFDEFYGVKVSSIGEDGDMIAFGHHDKRTALAVFNAYVRECLGFRNLHDYNGHHIHDPYERIFQTWAVVKTECGESDCEGTECRKCAEIKSCDWWLETNQSQETPGAFPVTEWR